MDEIISVLGILVLCAALVILVMGTIVIGRELWTK